MVKQLLQTLLLVPPMLVASLCTTAQGGEGLPAYPKNYFRNPLNLPMLLAGNFGECRSGHFHSGLDLKTKGEENQPVFAAADGYICRIKTDKGGFGHALYILHPNGYTTLYAHLNDYAPSIQKYLRKEQYEKKRWDVDITLSPTTFPVKKGQQIAWSGNTGGSTAPHLHFEIRDSKSEHPLNPQLFGLIVADKTPPLLHELALYPGNLHDGNRLTITMSRKTGTSKPLKTNNSQYHVLHDTVETPEGMMGIGLVADDYMDGSENTITFLRAALVVNDSLHAKVLLDDIGYNESRYINAYTDFRTKQKEDKWVQCLFLQPGNRLTSIYRELNANKGRIWLETGKVYKLELALADNNGNITTADFYLKPKPSVNASLPADSCTTFFAGKTNTYTLNDIMFSLDERQLYDDMCFTYSRTAGSGYSDKHQLHQNTVPIHHYFDLMLKPNRPIPFDHRSKLVLMYTDGKTENGSAAQSAEQGWYKSAVRSFGTYWLDVDTTAPVIKTLHKNGSSLQKAKQIAFEAKDAQTSVKKFSGLLDGKWICFEQHGSRFFYQFDEHCPKGKHTLVFTAEDENQNQSSRILEFTR